MGEMEGVAAWQTLHPAAPSSTQLLPQKSPQGGSAVPVPLGPTAAGVGSLLLVAQQLLEL